MSWLSGPFAAAPKGMCEGPWLLALPPADADADHGSAEYNVSCACTDGTDCAETGPVQLKASVKTPSSLA